MRWLTPQLFCICLSLAVLFLQSANGAAVRVAIRQATDAAPEFDAGTPPPQQRNETVSTWDEDTPVSVFDPLKNINITARRSVANRVGPTDFASLNGACPDGKRPCDGTCVDIKTDAANCGACGTVCPFPGWCENGKCTKECKEPLALCDAFRCVNITSDDNHCGRCNYACYWNEKCILGVCTPVCPAGKSACWTHSDSNEVGFAPAHLKCVNLTSDNNACGRCNVQCGSQKSCFQGVCLTAPEIAARKSGKPIKKGIVRPKAKPPTEYDPDFPPQPEEVDASQNSTRNSTQHATRPAVPPAQQNVTQVPAQKNSTNATQAATNSTQQAPAKPAQAPAQQQSNAAPRFREIESEGKQNAADKIAAAWSSLLMRRLGDAVAGRGALNPPEGNTVADIEDVRNRAVEDLLSTASDERS